MLREQAEKMYKGALLHVHFSGMVKAYRLLDAAWKIRDKIAFKSSDASAMLFYVGDKCPYEPNFAESDLEKCKEIVQKQWAVAGGENLNEDFGPIGSLFYHLIKHVDFYPTYMRLILEELNEQNIDYVELRLSLGKMFKYTGGGAQSPEPEKIFLPIRDELRVLAAARKHFAPKSFSIIAQFSKSQPSHVIDRKLNILRSELNADNTSVHASTLVVAIDIVGDELSGRELAEFAPVIKKHNFQAVLHAGEQYRNIQKSLRNINVAIQLTKHQNIRRIGHGLYYFTNKQIIDMVRSHGYVLEFCPESLKMFKNIRDDKTISQFINAGAAFCINSDDPNKIRDKDMNDNFLAAAEAGFTDFKSTVKNSIDAAFCGREMKLKMLAEWSKHYA